jgi:hypothetical protein
MILTLRIMQGLVRFATLCCVAGVISGCSDDPSALNAVGSQFIRAQVIVRTDTLRASSAVTFKQYIPMNDRVNLLGRFTSGGRVQNAHMLVQFFSSGLPNRDTVHVLSAHIKLKAVTWTGDSSAPLNVNIHEVARSWSQATLRWDSIVPGFYNSTPGSSFTGTIVRDTQFISIPLDTAMVRRWLRPATFTNNYGIILIPALTSNVIMGFHAANYDTSLTNYPTLVVVARNIAGNVTDTSSFTLAQDTFVGDVEGWTPSPDIAFVQGGVVYRSTMKFDMGRIPRGAIINDAHLTLHFEPARSRLGKFTSDTAVTIHRMVSTDSTVFESQGALSTSSLATSVRFVFDLRHQVQTWVRGPAYNFGVVLRSANANEFSSMDLFGFYTHAAADPGKRPELIVTYMTEAR